MIILAIETSCDDTGIAILKVKSKKDTLDKKEFSSKGLKVKSFEILANIVSSQVKLHQKYGGVWPFLAKREHQKNLPIVLNKALQEAGLANSKYQIENSISKINLIAVTIGPGLEPCLWTGINFAKELAKKNNLPIVPINHIEAHILVNLLNLLPLFSFSFSKKENEKENKKIFPAVCLVVSGGHTQLILMKDIGKYKILGETRDDAAGECFDKTARILGLGYPGGPAISAQAEQWKTKTKNSKLKKYSKFSIKLPRPMIKQKNYDFSFSGLKTAVLYLYQESKIKNEEFIQEFCFEIQQAIIDVLIEKTLKAAKEFKVKTIILAGGVAANDELRKQFKFQIENHKLKVNFLVPEKIFCTDNGAMVAISAFFNIAKNKFKIKKIDLEKIKANSNLKIDKNLI